MCLVSWEGSGPLDAGIPYTAMGDHPREGPLCFTVYCTCLGILISRNCTLMLLLLPAPASSARDDIAGFDHAGHHGDYKRHRGPSPELQGKGRCASWSGILVRARRDGGVRHRRRLRVPSLRRRPPGHGLASIVAGL